jgi:hypothetical protein
VNIALEAAPPRLAFLGPAALVPHMLGSCDWASTRLFLVERGNAAPVLAEVRAWAPDVCLVLAPETWRAEDVQALPGLKVGVVAAPLFDPTLLSHLAGLAQPGSGGFHWLTWPENPWPEALEGLPVLQTLPLPMDTSALPARPRFESQEVMVPEWTMTPPTVLEGLRRIAPVRMLSARLEGAALRDAVAEAGVLVYCSRDVLGRLDPLPLYALAAGVLLVTDAPFPQDWGIEWEDEYLHKPHETLAGTVEEARKLPQNYRPVRMRAWQKVRELFDASSAYRRLVHDARLFNAAMPGGR